MGHTSIRRWTERKSLAAPSDNFVERPLPHNLDAELAIVGAVMLDNAALTEAIKHGISPAHFFLPQHRCIYTRQMDLASRQIAIDIVTLTEELARYGELEAAGGLAYISQLADGLPRVSNVAFYARIVRDKATLRSVIHSAAAVYEEAFSGGAEADKVLQRLDSIITDGVERSRPTQSVHSVSPADFLRDVPETIYVAWPLAARGMAIAVDGPPKLAGKTTFTISALCASLRGGLFLNRETRPARILYVTEEGKNTFRFALRRFGLHDYCGDDFAVLSKPVHLAGKSWAESVALIRSECESKKFDWLILDTFAKLAGLKDDDENQSGAVVAAFEPIRNLCETLQIAVTLLRHTRKSGGEVGESARGSNALSGDVDSILQLRRISGSFENARQLEFAGRDVNGELDIELAGTEYRAVDDVAVKADADAERVEALVQFVRANGACSRTFIRDRKGCRAEENNRLLTIALNQNKLVEHGKKIRFPDAGTDSTPLLVPENWEPMGTE